MSTEVLVYGGTAGGVCAAVAAAGAGAATVLVTPGAHLGGMTSGGLGYTDVGDPRVLGGLAMRFRADVARHYGVAPGHFAGPEPHVAEAIFVRWLAEAGVEVVTGAEVSDVELQDGAITAVGFGPGLRISPGVVVDAGYEGDLLPLAGVPYAVGREDRARHGERFAGRQEIFPGRHAFPPWVSPFRSDPTGRQPGEVLDQVRDLPLAEVGAGDGGVMSYGFRVCLSRTADRIEFERPDGYDEEHWELGRRLFDHWARQGQPVHAGDLLGLTQNLPGGKCDGNSIGPFSLSVLDGSAWEYPDAAPARRKQIWDHHRAHAAGLLYFLAHDPGVPAGVRATMAEWGLPADEFADTGHLPHQLYIREGRRMVGDLVVTEADLRQGRIPDDTVALGSYHLDIREVQRTWRWVYEHPVPVATVVNEGYLSVPVPVYGIPYRAMVPPAAVCSNLLVACCLSASHVAFSSMRMEVQYQMIGHAAGLAAAAAVEADQPVQQIDLPLLRERLAQQGQVLRV